MFVVTSFRNGGDLTELHISTEGLNSLNGKPQVCRALSFKYNVSPWAAGVAGGNDVPLIRLLLLSLITAFPNALYCMQGLSKLVES